MAKVRTTLTVDKTVLDQAHAKGIDISRSLEQSLRAYLNGNSPRHLTRNGWFYWVFKNGAVVGRKQKLSQK